MVRGRPVGLLPGVSSGGRYGGVQALRSRRADRAGAVPRGNEPGPQDLRRRRADWDSDHRAGVALLARRQAAEGEADRLDELRRDDEREGLRREARLSPGRHGARPRVALETAFLTTGLPEDVRLSAALAMAAAVRDRGAEPAFVGMVEGRPLVGIDEGALEELAQSARKLSTRDLPVAAARGESGGTTVAATLFLAHREGVEVASTGGIGGVHPGGARFDESADLAELGRTPITLVCSGAKAILDLPATLERLDTLSVTVLGYGTDELPAFWSAETGLPLKDAVENAEEVATVLRKARALGLPGAILICVPPPTEAALSREESER